MSEQTVIETSRVIPAWHAIPASEAREYFQTPEGGLTTEEAERRLERYGPNVIERKENGLVLKILVRQIHDPLIYVLLASTVLAILTGKVVDGLVIFGVVLLNTIIGFVQEYRADRALKALSGMIPAQATVLRDGARTVLPASRLVPGDLVALQSGDKVPADLRLLEVRNLAIEESALTGESVPSSKISTPVDEDAGIGDRRCMAYSGTLVTYGTGTGVVVATGAGTELGRISSMLESTTEKDTPLTRQLGVIGKWITVGIVFTSIVLFGVGLLRGYPLGDAILVAVTLAVGAIPEGLPAIVTVALAIGVQRMAKRRAIVRRLPAVETLGSTTVICSDKTGTLTRNEMTVEALWTPEISLRVTGVGYKPEGELVTEQGEPAAAAYPFVDELLKAGVLCSDATLQKSGETWQITGDPTEGALVAAAAKFGLEAQTLRAAYRRLDAVPFESERQFMATLHEEPGGGHVIFLKGAPEVVLDRCVNGWVNGRSLYVEALDQVEKIAGRGMRVLAFAMRRVDPSHSELTEADVRGGFTFLGLQGMIDPPRAEAMAAVQACREAGITVKMITGDHKETARAIGESLGLIGKGDRAITGAELSELSDEAFHRTALEHNVFARVAPEHKLRLVQALQNEGHVTAMTGDGVNDAPALKQADIGVAMGYSGTAVSKEAAAVVLTDDNFATIEAAVEEGRRVYDNLIKALAFVLPTNLGLALIMSVAVAFFPIVHGQPLLPVEPVQILWINLVAAVALALPLAFEAMEPNLMHRPPRSPNAPVLSLFVVARTIFVAMVMTAGAVGLFLHEYREALAAGMDAHPARAVAQTEAVTTIILFQIFYLINCRSLKDSFLAIGFWSNPWIFVGIGLVLALHIGFIYLPFMNAIFGSTPIDLGAWGEALQVAFPILILIGLEKWWRKRYEPEGTSF